MRFGRRRRSRSPRIRLGPLYRRNPAWLLVVLVLAGLGLLGRGRVGPPSDRPVGNDFQRYHEQTFRVVDVLDGDTLDIEAPDDAHAETRIRLWGVDTPEVAGAPGGEMYWGPQASAFTKKLLMGQTVRLELVPGHTRDKYNRLLAYVYAASTGEMLNARLLEEGHAYADSRFSHPFKKQFASSEASAAAARVGLWRAVKPEQMPAWRRKQAR